MTNKKDKFNDHFNEYRESLGEDLHKGTFQDFIL